MTAQQLCYEITTRHPERQHPSRQPPGLLTSQLVQQDRYLQTNREHL